ncbi:MAG: hypothetical protein N3A38_02815 [Planctomycetota bacterium]|nr:hypothetical protein [Planctomycetota bacterium]
MIRRTETRRTMGAPAALAVLPAVAALVSAGYSHAANVDTRFELDPAPGLPARKAAGIALAPGSRTELRFELKDVNGVGAAFWTKEAPRIGIRLEPSDPRIKVSFAGQEGESPVTLDRVKSNPAAVLSFAGEQALFSETVIPFSLKIVNLKPGSRVILDMSRPLEARVAPKVPLIYLVIAAVILLLLLALLAYLLYRWKKRKDEEAAAAAARAAAEEAARRAAEEAARRAAEEEAARRAAEEAARAAAAGTGEGGGEEDIVLDMDEERK